MSDLESIHLKLPYLAPAQAQKHVTHNEALRRLDGVVQLAVLDATSTAPPADPDKGDRHIVAAPATGGWTGREGQVAVFIDGAWEFLVPEDGWITFDIDAEMLLVRHDDAWGSLGSYFGAVDRFGVNTAPDDVNRLAVRSAAVLFTGIAAADGGSGDVRFVVNKETDADTASLLFQSGWSGRAEVGLAGDTDFVFKVSADGSAWTEAIRIDKATGLPTILYDNGASGLAATNVQDAIDEIAASGGGGGGGAVASVFGRAGAVVAAAGDYDASQIDNDSAVSGATVKAALETVKGWYDTLVAGVSTSYDTLAELAAGLATKLTAASNLSDLASAATARTNLGLGDAATKNTGTISGTVAAGDDSRITGAAQKASNLSDLASVATAFANIKQAATDAATGVVELATDAEAQAGTDTARAVTPAGLAAAALKQGKTELWLGAELFRPQITNGPSRTYAELGTNLQVLDTLDFDTSTQEFASAFLKLPKKWGLGTLTFRPHWTAASGSGGVVWALQAAAVSDGDPLNPSWGTEQTSADTFIAANDLHRGPESTAITVGGSPADGDGLWLRIKRNVADGSDTLAVDAQLLGVELFFTTAAATDA